MATEREAVEAVKQHAAQFQPVIESWPAWTGNADGNVADNNPNNILVRFPNLDSPAVPVFNGGVPMIANLNIRVGYRPEQPTLMQALGVSDTRAVVTGTIAIPNVGPHGQTHMKGYSDPAPLRFAQIYDLAVYPGTGFVVNLYTGILTRGGSTVTIAAQTIDLAAHVPGAGALYVLVTLDASGAVALTDGAAATLATLNDTFIPATPAGHIRLAAVRLWAGQTDVRDDNTQSDIIDLRWPQEIANGHIIKDEGTPLTNRAALNFVGGGVTVTDDSINNASIVTVPAVVIPHLGQHLEVVMSGLIPADPVLTPDGTDWVYDYVSD